MTLKSPAPGNVEQLLIPLTEIEKAKLLNFAQRECSQEVGLYIRRLCIQLDGLLGQAPSEDAHGQTEQDYTELGRSFFEEYNLKAVQNHPAMEGFICCDSPVEIITHLLNTYDEDIASAEARGIERAAKAVSGLGKNFAAWAPFREKAVNAIRALVRP